MNNFFFINNHSAQESITLNALVADFESGSPSFFPWTWVRGERDLYWTTIECHKELNQYLHWEYIDAQGKKHSLIQGNQLKDLFSSNIIKENTHVKLSFGFEWIEYKSSQLYIKNKKHDFHGIASHKPDKRNHVARVIDFIIYSFLPVFFSFLFSKQSDFFIALTLFLGFMELFLPIISSFFEACSVSLFGRTIGAYITGLFVIHSNGTKLTFFQAFARQWTININSRSRTRAGYLNRSLSPYGATKWDRDHGCVVTTTHTGE